jgi:hypothetical protein
MARSGDRGDLLAAGLGPGPVKEQFASEISEDVTCVAAAQDGDRAAFGQLYERYARMVHGVLLVQPASFGDPGGKPCTPARLPTQKQSRNLLPRPAQRACETL